MSVNSGGSSAMAMDTGSRATITFNGTGVTWIGYRDAWSGIANVYVDDVLKSTVDTYAASDVAQAKQYSVSGLASGSHKLSIEVTGKKGTSSQGLWVWVDAFDVMSGTATTSSTPSPTSAPVPRQYSDTIMNSGDFLLPGQSRQSGDGRFRLVYQVDGNLVLYQGSNPLWATATYGTTPGFVSMQTDGNFVVYDSTGRPVWASNTWGRPGAGLMVQDDGNTVIYSTGSSPLWATNTWGR